MSSIRFIACLYLISVFGNCHEDPYYQPFDKLNITLDIYTYEDLVPYTVDNDLPNPNDYQLLSLRYTLKIFGLRL
ncbi:unknown [Taterapox virus]|uniref:Poxvirus TNF receptor-II C-terminal domain-containing protein n=1 Tax=Taterapox virus TaxID=28871 RepID=Q0NPJ0_9POXV|nr:hypothetical protein TATV_DAH68_021 [Taterapox virus]ABD97587.1 unknown [Taterapox virus]